MGLIAITPTLTRREREVGRMLLDDYSVAEIAEELMLTRETVRMHMQSLYRRLEVSHPEGLRKYRHLLED